MKPTQEQVIAWAREAGAEITDWIDKCFGEDVILFDKKQLQAAMTAAYEAGRESMKVDSIHTCHDQCQRPACVAIREAYEAGRSEAIREREADEWQDLTDDESDEIWGECLGVFDCLRMTQAKLKEKNA